MGELPHTLLSANVGFASWKLWIAPPSRVAVLASNSVEVSSKSGATADAGSNTIEMPPPRSDASLPVSRQSSMVVVSPVLTEVL